MITKHEWWSTPVWEIETGFDDYFNLCFENELIDLVREGEPNKRVDVWSLESYYCKQLKNKIYETLDLILPDYFEKYHEMKPFISQGWLNLQNPGQSFPLHIHERTDLACVYYIRACENSGDLIMVDTRGSAAWNLPVENGITSIKYKRIKPKPGKMVLFPSYVLHSVEENKSEKIRIGIATNIHIPSKPYITPENTY
jgi:uncharacterized protein (TIGR02466 family)